MKKYQSIFNQTIPIFTILFILNLSGLYAQQTLIQAGRLINTKEGKVTKNVEILIEGNIIKEVGKNLKHSKSAKIIDLKNKTVLPGLIDSHTHICLTPDYTKNPPVLYKTNPLRSLEALAGAQAALQAGFTTLRDVDNEGADMADIAVRDAIKAGLFTGPRLFVSGWAISITSGHMNLTGLRPEIDKKVDQYAIMADSKEAMIKAIREQHKSGVDFIKIYATGTLRHVSREDFSSLSQLSVDEVRLMVKEAGRWGMDVASHAYGGEGAYNSVAGGVRSVEHGLFLDNKTLDLMVEKGTFWSPTLSAYVPGPGDDAEMTDFLNKIVEQHQKTFESALEKGVKIAFGTDIGAIPHDQGWQELKRMADYGMAPMDVLKSATITGAELLRKEKSLGHIAPGYLADIIAVDGNPDKDIEVLRNISFVMVDGVVIKQEN